MLETIVVLGIVAVVAVMVGRSFYRILTGKDDGCGAAAGCHSCAAGDHAELCPERDVDE